MQIGCADEAQHRNERVVAAKQGGGLRADGSISIKEIRRSFRAGASISIKVSGDGGLQLLRGFMRFHGGLHGHVRTGQHAAVMANSPLMRYVRPLA